MLRRISGLIGATAFALMANAATAHPHIFINTGLELQFDDAGMLAAVRIVWGYDSFYSLSTLTDLGLDPDADEVLTAAELARLQGFDMQWMAGFEGDTYLQQGTRMVKLGGPLSPDAKVIGGHIVTTHLRRVLPAAAPVDPADGPLVIRVYDPTYCTAYEITLPVLFIGRQDCDAKLVLPDETAANAALAAALSALGPTQTLEDAGVDVAAAVGGAFAPQVTVTCSG